MKTKTNALQPSVKAGLSFAVIVGLFIVRPFGAFGQGLEFEWAHQIANGDGSGDRAGRAIAVDPDGNLLVAAYISGRATFGTNALTSARSWNCDSFLAKYDPAGNVLWAKQSGGVGNIYLLDMAVDRHGNSYVAGWFCCGTVTFGNTTLTALFDTTSDTFLAKYDSQGALLWVRSHRSINIDVNKMGIAVDRDDNPYLVGSFTGTVTFDGKVSITSHGDWDAFVAKYDTDGAVAWAHEIGGSHSDFGASVGTDAAGKAYVTGSLGGSATLGGRHARGLPDFSREV